MKSNSDSSNSILKFVNSGEKWLLLIVFFLGFIVRLYRIDFPLADWHSWRQADTASVSKIFAEEGFDLLYPRYFDISNIQTGLNNPEGYRFVEFPLYNLVHAALFKFTGIFSLVVWGRLLTTTLALVSGLFIYLTVKKFWGKRMGMFSLLIYLFMPFSIFYGRTILPDTAMVAASLGGIYFFMKYTEKKNRYLFLLLSSVMTAASFLLKPYAIFFALPQIFIAFSSFGKKTFFMPELYVHAAAASMPLVLWRMWIQQFPEGVPANTWLLNGNNIRFRPAFFRWIGYERITRIISGYSGVLLIIAGLYASIKINHKWILFSFLLSSTLYVSIFATGNVQHDYYQILILPSVAIIMGIGAGYLWQRGKSAKIAVLILLTSAFYFSYLQVKDYFNINNEAIIKAGQRVDMILPKDAKVIAPYNGDTTLLYHIERRGWPAFQDSPENLKKLGATYIVLVNPTQNDIDTLGVTYEIIEKSNEYLILKL